MERYEKESPITEQAKALHKDRPNGPTHLKAEHNYTTQEKPYADGKDTPLAEEFPSIDEKETSSNQVRSEDNPAIRGI